MAPMKIFSVSDDEKEFFRSLSEGEVFGFSGSFTREAVIFKASLAGLTVSPPALKSPERKQHGDFVLKVRRVREPRPSKSLRLGQEFIFLERVRAARKCAGFERVPHVIPPKELCGVRLTPKTLGGGVAVSNKTNLCLPCLQKLIAAKVKTLKEFSSYILEEERLRV